MFIAVIILLVLIVVLYCIRKKSNTSSQFNITTNTTTNTTTTTAPDLLDIINMSDNEFEQFVHSLLTSYLKNSENNTIDINSIVTRRLELVRNKKNIVSLIEQTRKEKLLKELEELYQFITKSRRHKTRRFFCSKYSELLIWGIEQALSRKEPMLFFRFTINGIEPYFEAFYNFVYSEDVFDIMSDIKKAKLQEIIYNLANAYCSYTSSLRSLSEITDRETRLINFVNNNRIILEIV